MVFELVVWLRLCWL